MGRFWVERHEAPLRTGAVVGLRFVIGLGWGCFAGAEQVPFGVPEVAYYFEGVLGRTSSQMDRRPAVYSRFGDGVDDVVKASMRSNMSRILVSSTRQRLHQ